MDALPSLEFPRRSPGLDIDATDEGYIVYRPELDRVHYLNPTAAVVLEFCTGENSIAEIAQLAQHVFGLPVAPDSVVREAIGKLRDEGLLQ